MLIHIIARYKSYVGILLLQTSVSIFWDHNRKPKSRSQPFALFVSIWLSNAIQRLYYLYEISTFVDPSDAASRLRMYWSNISLLYYHRRGQGRPLLQIVGVMVFQDKEFLRSVFYTYPYSARDPLVIGDYCFVIFEICFLPARRSAEARRWVFWHLSRI